MPMKTRPILTDFDLFLYAVCPNRKGDWTFIGNRAVINFMKYNDAHGW